MLALPVLGRTACTHACSSPQSLIQPWRPGRKLASPVRPRQGSARTCAGARAVIRDSACAGVTTFEMAARSGSGTSSLHLFMSFLFQSVLAEFRRLNLAKPMRGASQNPIVLTKTGQKLAYFHCSKRERRG
jgi:hypothetical protein